MIETNKIALTSYQKFIITILAFLQFTIILDFMVLSPLGALLMPELHITAAQFGLVVSAYAFSAGIAGFLAAGFADRFDRKKLLLFFYSGFLVGTLLCGIADTYEFLLFARMITGLFGGVVGSVVFAITTDLFQLEVRGRVMGVVQAAFAGSQVLGLPIALYLSNHWGWHAPFLMIVAVCVIVGVFIVVRMQPICGHLEFPSVRNPYRHFIHTITQPRYIQGFATTALLSTGGFMMMPFGSAFSVNNLGIAYDKLPLVYVITGVISMITGPIIGRMSDKVGKLKVFIFGSILTITTVVIYTRLGVTPIAVVIAISALMFVGISSRMISSSALVSAIPSAPDRGSYMSISASVQQISGGIAAAIAGLIVVQNQTGKLEHFDMLGDVVNGSTIITIVMMYFINSYIQKHRTT